MPETQSLKCNPGDRFTVHNETDEARLLRVCTASGTEVHVTLGLGMDARIIVGSESLELFIEDVGVAPGLRLIKDTTEES